MTDRTVRMLGPDEHRAAHALFSETLHKPASDDEDWQRRSRAFQAGRAFGAFDGGELVGTARSVDVSLLVPGCPGLEAGAVTGVGVRAHRTRRGVLRDLMDAQLREFADRGVYAAVLLASEGGIYGRFGYGVGTVERSYRLNRHRARVRDQAPSAGDVDLLDFETAFRVLPQAYAASGAGRAGMISRPEYLWAGWEGRYRRSGAVTRAAVHRDREGIDGYAMYRVEHTSGADAACVLTVEDMVTGTAAAFADLWRFLLGVDLVDRIEVDSRPLDEPLELVLDDPKECRVTGAGDHLWVRLVDVPAALSSRAYGDPGHADDHVVLAVEDPILPGNSGAYALSPTGATRTDRAAQVYVDADALAMLYLGTWRPASLAQAGRLEVRDSRVLDTVERLFATSSQPWCGTHF